MVGRSACAGRTWQLICEGTVGAPAFVHLGSTRRVIWPAGRELGHAAGQRYRPGASSADSDVTARVPPRALATGRPARNATIIAPAATPPARHRPHVPLAQRPRPVRLGEKQSDIPIAARYEGPCTSVSRRTASCPPIDPTSNQSPILGVRLTGRGMEAVDPRTMHGPDSRYDAPYWQDHTWKVAKVRPDGTRRRYSHQRQTVSIRRGSGMPLRSWLSAARSTPSMYPGARTTSRSSDAAARATCAIRATRRRTAKLTGTLALRRYGSDRGDATAEDRQNRRHPQLRPREEVRAQARRAGATLGHERALSPVGGRGCVGTVGHSRERVWEAASAAPRGPASEAFVMSAARCSERPSHHAIIIDQRVYFRAALTRSLIIDGPPGTGKDAQTILNLIALPHRAGQDQPRRRGCQLAVITCHRQVSDRGSYNSPASLESGMRQRPTSVRGSRAARGGPRSPPPRRRIRPCQPAPRQG